MPHFEWLALAHTGSSISSVWVKALLGVVIGAFIVAAIMLVT